ncbi:MAG: hypothetical protein JXA25_13130 [Anaerolineales bacterium]|nr:hypothetical protein [Anaerolineales bacterium]
MTTKKPFEKVISILGEGEIQANLLPGREGEVSINYDTGGIWRTEQILRALLEEASLPDVRIICQPAPVLQEGAGPDRGTRQVFQTWRAYQNAWRICEVLGRTQVSGGAQEEKPHSVAGHVVLLQDQNPDTARTVQLDFAGGLPEWIVYAAGAPLFESSVWKQVYDKALDRTILILDIEDLRKDFLSISEGISWEKTIENLIVEIYQYKKPRFYALRECPYVVVRFGLSALLLLENRDDQADCCFVFDPQRIEWEFTRLHPGSIDGVLESLMALLGFLAVRGSLEPEILQRFALQALFLSRTLQRDGRITQEEFRFPLSPVVESIKPLLKPENGSGGSDLAQVRFNSSRLISLVKHEQTSNWSLLDIQQQTDYLELAKDIVRYGPEVSLTSTPMCRMGHLLTIDRSEIESYRYIKKLMVSYLHQKGNNKPLSIAVFGFPGSGKSFGVKQIAKSLKDEGFMLTSTTFNLSQFNQPEELYQAFHQVRDIILSGEIPLIFWDEFDTEKLKWLRYFLAPMQDGQFQEGQLVHNVGEAVFIFAGGTCSSIDQFRELCSTPDGRANKGPDFVSRLKGSISIKGPNSIICYQKDGEPVAVDPYWMLRRAILLRSMLQMGTPSIFEKRDGIKFARIEDGVLNAFLNIPQYFHGARSIETILSISDLQGESCYTRSLLPPASELELHVDGESFMDLVEEVVFSDEDIERMAKAIHAAWQKQKSTGDLQQQDAALIAYDTLPLDEKRQNRTSARSILRHVRAIGLDLIPLTASAKPVTLTSDQIEEMARMEHQRWVLTHIRSGWEYAPVTRKSFKQHNDLVPWDEEEKGRMVEVYGPDEAGRMGTVVLSDSIRDLDRVIVRSYPDILRQAGYTLVAGKKA